MIKLKRIVIFILFTFLTTITFSTSLKSITYTNNSVSLNFTSRAPIYKGKYDKTIPTALLSFVNTDKYRKLPDVTKIGNKYVDKVLVEKHGKYLNVLFYLNGEYIRKYNRVGNSLVVNYEDIEKKVDKKIVDKSNKDTGITKTTTTDTTTLPTKIDDKRNYVIIIDPGHGGKDNGTSGYGYNEKDLALKVGLLLYNNLKKEYKKVIITRDTDVFIPLDERAEIGNRANADLFVSIHLNHSSNPNASGTEAFYFEKNPSRYAAQLSEYENNFDKKGTEAIENKTRIIVEDVLYKLNQRQSSALANTVIENLSKDMGIRKRRVQGANFAVLRGSHSPSILIELGFMSNKDDLNKYLDPEGQQKAADSIFESIKKHYWG